MKKSFSPICIMIFSENSVLQDTKLVTWEGGISFSFTEVGNVKGILNDFLNWFKFFLTELIFRSLKNKFLGCLDFIFFKKEKGRFSKFLRLLPLLSKVFCDKLFKNLEFDSVSGFPLSKASFSWEILCKVNVSRARIKLSVKIFRARNLLVSYLRSETKGFRFGSGC